MKKFTVSVIIIGAFILYCFLYHANAVAFLPTTSTDTRSSTTPSSSSATTSTPSGTGTPGSDTSIPSSSSAATPMPGSTGAYKDGTYTGSVADAHWGNIQVQVTIQGGKIADVQFLQYPNDRGRSIAINNSADPQLANEAIQAQSANVDIVTGATDTSEAFIQSLTDALAQAK